MSLTPNLGPASWLSALAGGVNAGMDTYKQNDQYRRALGQQQFQNSVMLGDVPGAQAAYGKMSAADPVTGMIQHAMGMQTAPPPNSAIADYIGRTQAMQRAEAAKPLGELLQHGYFTDPAAADAAWQRYAAMNGLPTTRTVTTPGTGAIPATPAVPAGLGAAVYDPKTHQPLTAQQAAQVAATGGSPDYPTTMQVSPTMIPETPEIPGTDATPATTAEEPIHYGSFEPMSIYGRQITEGGKNTREDKALGTKLTVEQMKEKAASDRQTKDLAQKSAQFNSKLAQERSLALTRIGSTANIAAQARAATSSNVRAQIVRSGLNNLTTSLTHLKAMRNDPLMPEEQKIGIQQMESSLQDQIDGLSSLKTPSPPKGKGGGSGGGKSNPFAGAPF